MAHSVVAMAIQKATRAMVDHGGPIHMAPIAIGQLPAQHRWQGHVVIFGRVLGPRLGREDRPTEATECVNAMSLW